MHKVVINTCFGGFSLSDKAEKWLSEKGLKFDWSRGIERHNPLLVECVETLGKEANGSCARLAVEIIDSNMYRIDEYDGQESVITPDNQDYTIIS